MKIENLSKKYNDESLFSDVNMNLDKAGLYVLIGESGTGKTSFLNIITKYITDYEGNICFDEDKIQDIKYEDMVYYISSVPQNYRLHNYLTVYENLKIIPFEVKGSIDKVLKILNILEIKNRKVNKLSGGEKQRVAIARAILMNSPIIVFDEPTSSIDNKNYAEFMKIINILKKDRVILIVTHDNRIINDADILYKLENQKVKLIKNDSQNNKKIKNRNRKNKKYKRINWLFFKRTLSFSLNTYILYFFIMLLFILSFFFINSYRINILNGWMSNIDDSSIHMNTNMLYDDVGFNGKIYWNEKDIENLKSIEHVKDVVPFEEHSSLMADVQGNALEDETISYNDKEISLSFETVRIPEEIYNNYGYYKPNIVAGSYPKNDSDELLIPDVWAYQLNENINDLIGTSITLNTSGGEKDYKIVGIYELQLKDVTDYIPVYTGNNLDYYDSTSYAPTKERYEDYKDMIEEDSRIEDKSSYDMTYDEYVESVGIGLEDLLIKVDSPENIKSVEESIKNMYPDYILESQYEYKYGILHERLKKLDYITFTYFIIAVLVFMIMNYLLFKNYLLLRIKEFNINYALGYPKSKLVSLIAIELIVKNGILFMFIIILSVILIFNGFGNIVNINNLVSAFLFIIFSNLLNILSIYRLLRNDKLRNSKIID